MGENMGPMLEVDGVERNRMGALGGVPWWVVCAKVPRNVVLWFCADPEEKFGVQREDGKQFAWGIAEESACFREGHAAFAQDVWVGCWAKTCREAIHRDMESTEEELNELTGP